MTAEFFSFKTPRDMYEKALRERERMRADPHIDNVYNFFVTIRHIVDYVKRSDSFDQKRLNDLESDPIIKACRDVADKGKHLVLTGRKDKPREDPIARKKSYSFFTAPFGTVGFNQFRTVWELHVDGKVFDVHKLADPALEKWKLFLDDSGF